MFLYCIGLMGGERNVPIQLSLSGGHSCSELPNYIRDARDVDADNPDGSQHR